MQSLALMVIGSELSGVMPFIEPVMNKMNRIGE